MSWELGDVTFGIRRGTSGPYTQPAATWPIDYADTLDFAMSFYVVNGPGTIALGEMFLQRNVDGAGWEDVASLKLMAPGHGSGLAQVPPDIFSGTIAWFGQYPGASIRLRARLAWTTPGLSGEHLVPVGEDLTGSGELAEFFQLEDHGCTAVVLSSEPRRILALFNDPGALELRIHGRRPTLTCEHDLVLAAGAGDTVRAVDREFVVRGKQRQTDLVDLVLEEVG